jgi:predicted O-linked N-acetylglucosamine transferase (SPINDLY family)
VLCFADVPHADAQTAAFQQIADGWHNVTGRTDRDVAALVQRERVDILVDCAGHTRGNRLAVFARKPAPVQVTWLGFPGTTGLPAIDFRFTDAIADPPGADAFATETLVRLPHGFLCYAPPLSVPDVAPAPSALTGRITFGSFNNLAKLTPAVIETWARILGQVPGARLLLKAKQFSDPPTRASALDRFAAGGIAADRLDVRTTVAAQDAHLAAYAAVDIALDPFPYNGATTTCEALWMGVPVVTLRGQRHAGRVGASLLTHAGLGEWIADTIDDYVAKAVALAQDRGQLAARRMRLRDQVMTSALGDARGFAATVEDAYRVLWERWCATDPAP